MTPNQANNCLAVLPMCMDVLHNWRKGYETSHPSEGKPRTASPTKACISRPPKRTEPRRKPRSRCPSLLHNADLCRTSRPRKHLLK
eukprot:190631-Prorocentrum_lima.AAC.1